MIARASQWTSEQVAVAVEGSLDGPADREVVGVSTDTRDALRDHLFVAIRGERYDAHQFLSEAVAAGASALMVDRMVPEDLGAAVPVIRVADTLTGLGRLARAHRRRSKAKILALTGSNGKTTTKEMIASILSVSFRVLKTEGNLNNLVGMPMTVLGLRPDHEIAVLEMGMNAPGEIAKLTEVAEPDAALITNVGPAHIGELGSIEAIAAAKGELFQGIDRDRAFAVVNLDDERVVRAADSIGFRHRRSFGESHRADVRLVSYESRQRAEYEVDGIGPIEVELPYPGRHNAMNAAAAIAATTLPLEGIRVGAVDIAEGLATSSQIAGRFQIERIGPYEIVDDCYNANRASMGAAIETVSALVEGRGRGFVALLGEMRELGAYSGEEHLAVGRMAALKGARVVAAFGKRAGPIAEGAAQSSVETRHEPEDLDALFAWLRGRLHAGDMILVKGSRDAQMERFIRLFKKEVS